MENEQRALGEFFARLASIPSLDALRGSELLLCAEELAELVTKQGLTTISKKRAAFWGGILREVHGHVHPLISGLLAGQTVTTPPIPAPERVLRLSPSGIIEEGRPWQHISDRLLTEFLALLRPHRPFPFRRCPVCQTVFVPVKRQKFCSPNCTYKSIEANRKEEKREYMRQYMANRRKRAKKAKATTPQRKEA